MVLKLVFIAEVAVDHLMEHLVPFSQLPQRLHFAYSERLTTLQWDVIESHPLSTRNIERILKAK